jgi:pre-mRNA-processing factor 19
MQPSSSTASIEQIKGFKQVASFPPHKTHSPGVLSVDIHPVRQELTVTGGVDKTAVLFNRVTGKKEATLTGHTKKVTCTLFHPTSPGVFTGSADHTVKIWSSQDSGDKPRHTISLHSGEIVSLSLHATNEYIVSASADRTWAIHNIETGQSLLQVSEPDDSPLTCAMLHPDGMILATGTADDLVRIWDLKEQKNIATFRGHKGAICDLKFSENGYYLATAAQDNILKLWDLRGPKNINSLKLESSVVALDYDLSGKYLAAAMGSEIRVFTGKNLEHVRTFADHTQTVTGVKWGANAQFLASTSMDRSLKFWS